MKRFEWIAPALVLGLVVSVSGQAPTTPAAQAATQKPVQQAVDQPADFTAFNEASKAGDPKKKIEALQKFITDYPDSMLVTVARSQIFDQLASSIQQATKGIRTEIEKIGEENASSPFSPYSNPAATLLRAGIMLEDAEQLAEKGLAANADPRQYVEQARAARSKPKPANPKGTPTGGFSMRTVGGVVTMTYVPAKPSDTPRPEPTDDDLRAQYRSQRGQLQNTLAQIYLKRGKNAESERLFKEVYATPDIPPGTKAVAVRQLAEFARKAGDDKALAQYLMELVVAGAKPPVHTELRDVYKKTHNGSLDGLESTLDAMYEKSRPKIDVKPFDRTKVPEPRVVLAELFTGSECPPCVGIDLAFDAALERFKPEDLAFLVYHQHIPGPDPMTNPSTETRRLFYNVRGVPTHYIDGKTDGGGGGGADLAERYYSTRVKPDIELAMGVRPEAKLGLTASMTGSTIRVKASVAGVTSKSDKLRLQIVLAEERLRFQGGNGIRFHPMVVRSVASLPLKAVPPAKPARGTAPARDAAGKDAAATPTREQGFPVVPGKALKVDYVFDLAKIGAENRKFIDDFLTKPFRDGDKPTFSSRMDDIDPRHLVVVAFVQDEDAKQGGGETAVADEKLAQNAATLRHVLQAATVRIGSPKVTN